MFKKQSRKRKKKKSVLRRKLYDSIKSRRMMIRLNVKLMQFDSLEFISGFFFC